MKIDPQLTMTVLNFAPIVPKVERECYQYNNFTKYNYFKFVEPAYIRLRVDRRDSVSPRIGRDYLLDYSYYYGDMSITGGRNMYIHLKQIPVPYNLYHIYRKLRCTIEYERGLIFANWAREFRDSLKDSYPYPMIDFLYELDKLKFPARVDNTL